MALPWIPRGTIRLRSRKCRWMRNFAADQCLQSLQTDLLKEFITSDMWRRMMEDCSCSRNRMTPCPYRYTASHYAANPFLREGALPVHPIATTAPAVAADLAAACPSLVLQPGVLTYWTAASGAAPEDAPAAGWLGSFTWLQPCPEVVPGGCSPPRLCAHHGVSEAALQASDPEVTGHLCEVLLEHHCLDGPGGGCGPQEACREQGAAGL